MKVLKATVLPMYITPKKTQNKELNIVAATGTSYLSLIFAKKGE